MVCAWNTTNPLTERLAKLSIRLLCHKVHGIWVKVYPFSENTHLCWPIFMIKRFVLSCCAIVLFLPFYAQAVAATLTAIGMDKTINIDQLIKNREVAITTRRDHNMIYVDASAVLQNDAVDILLTTTRYDQYVSWGMPGLKQCRLLQQDGNQFTTWNWVSSFGFSSKHCLQATRNILPERDSGYVQWQLASCPKHPQDLPKALTADYEDLPAFKSLNGYFYLENIHRDSSENLVYVRYSLALEVHSIFPTGFVYWISKSKIKSDIVDVIHILDRVSKSDQGLAQSGEYKVE